MIKPNFIIVGAAKCGTTALYVYLKDHPRVFLSPVKEPRYFAEDMPNLMNRVATRDDYLRLFKGANDGHIAVGEASPQYIYSSVAPAKIRAFNPDARIIAMLRNPVDMAWAAHAECLYWFVVLGLAGLVGFTGLAAGSYPAFYLSSFQPIQTIRQKGQTGTGRPALRNVLVVLQFAISTALIISTLIVL